MAKPIKSAWTYIGVYRGHLIAGAITLILTSSFALAVPYVLGRIVDALAGDDPTSVIPPLALIMIGLALGQAAARIASRVSLFNAARHAEHDLRSDLFKHLMTLDAEFYRAHPTGDVMSRVTNDVTTVRAMWGPGLLNIINTSFLFVVALFLMLSIDWRLTLVSLLPYPSIVILGLWFGRRIFRTSRAVQEKLGHLSNNIQEDLTGIGVIKTYHLEDHRADKFRTESTELLARNMKLTKVRGLLGPALGGIASLGTVMVLWVGANAVISGRINLGQLVQFNAYLALLVWPTLALGWMFSLFQRGRASWERLAELLEAEPVVKGGERQLDAGAVRGDLELAGLTVERDGRKILDDVSLRCEAGTITCLVGRVGCGKTTVLEALCRLIDIEPGQVFIDGIDLTELELTSLRSAVGYAPQEAFLFSTTIAQNIRFGIDRRAGGRGAVADHAIADEIHRAALIAGLANDLDALPAGLETMVGERGITLSGGQRQRVALARAVATDPQVLVLDDSLSSVDAETERDILGRLDEVMKDRTTVIVSHRVGVLKRADQIAVLDEGRLVETGTHDELLAAGGVYTELYRTQLAIEDDG